MGVRWRSVAVRTTLGATLLFGGVAVAGPAVTADGATPALKITVYCYSTKERTVVKNRTSRTVTLKSVGSIYKPYSNEPFPVTKRLAPGKQITYYTGAGATKSNPKTLTRRSIYQNTVGTREGARVKTTAGKSYTDRCG
jgi:hypothetical protein